MTYSDVILADSPVGYWKLDETSGTTAADSSTNSNDGTISGSPTMGANGLVFEPSGKAISFDGVDDVINVGNGIDTLLNGANVLTFEAWAKVPPFANNEPLIVTPIGSSTNTGALFAVDNGKLRGFGRSASADPGQDAHSIIDSFDDNKVHHFVIIFDYIGDDIRMFADGVLIPHDLASPAFSDAVVVSGPTHQTRIGASVSLSNYGTAKIQHAAIYDAALTPLQIRKHYQAGIAQGYHKEVLALNPTAYFPLNEASGDAIDWSGNDNNGTLSGGVTQGATGALAYDDSTAYTFDGVDDVITTTYDGVLGSGQRTICGFFTTPSITTNQGFFHYGADSTGQMMVGRVSTGSKFEITYWSYKATGSTTLVAGQTYFFAAVLTGTNANTTELYLDGVRETETYTAGTINTIATSNLRLGQGNVSYEACDLQGVAMFDTALTAAQIRTLYQAGKTLIESRGYPKVIQNLNPAAYWRLGEASGTTAFDESGNGNDLTINGAPTMATVDGPLHQSSLKSMTFDGVDDNITGNTSGLVTGLRTILAWFKPATSVNSSDNTEVIYVDDFSIRWHHPTNSSRVTLYDGATLYTTTFSGVTTNKYHLVVGVFDGTTIKSYVDGVLDTSTNVSGAPSGGALTGIATHSNGSQFLDADLAEAAVFNTALTAQQIKQIYEAGKSRYAAEVISYQPVNYFRQNEASGNAVDYGSLGNDGVWTGSPTYEQASEVITNESDNKSIAVTTSESLAFTSHAATTTYSLLTIAKPTALSGSQELFTDGTDSLKFNGTNLSLFYSSAEHNSDTTLVAGEAHLVGVSVNAGAATFNLDGANDGSAASATSFAPTKLYDLTFAGTGDEAAVFSTALSDEQFLDIYEMASFSFSFLGIAGTITESFAATDFYIRASQLDTGAFIGDVAVAVDNTYTFDFSQIAGYETYADEVLLTALPKTGKRRLNNTAYSVGDYYIPADVTTNDHIYKVTVAGTTAASEPVLDQAGGTTVDGTVTVQDMGSTPTPQTLIDYAVMITQ